MSEELAGTTFPGEIREPFEKVPAGTVLFTIEDVAEGMAGKDENDQVLVIQAHLVGEEPAGALGVGLDTMFFIGIRESDKVVQQGKATADPEGQLAATWAARAGRFQAFATKSGVEIAGKDRQLVYSELKGRQVLGLVEHVIDPKNPDFSNARIKSYWAVGEREPATSDAAPTQKAAPAAGPRPAATAPAPAPRAAGPAPAMAGAAVRPPVRRLGAR